MEPYPGDINNSNLQVDGSLGPLGPRSCSAFAAFPGSIPVQQCLIQQLTRLKLVLSVVIDANCMLIVVPIIVVDAIVT